MSELSLFVEVLAAAGINHLLHDLLIGLMLELWLVAALLSLLVRCLVYFPVALEK